MTRSRPRVLRAPFIVTVAAVACGGSAEGGDERHVSVNPPYPSPYQCPSTAPVHGAACRPAGTACEYDVPCSFRQSATCVDGVWNVTPGGPSTGSCNPPFPMACPSVQPVEGTPCNLVLGACPYVDRSGCASTATCNSGVWAITFEICNPPPCPVEPPIAGEACYDPGAPCEYVDEVGCSVLATCSGAWNIEEQTCGGPGGAGGEGGAAGTGEAGSGGAP